METTLEADLGRMKNEIAQTNLALDSSRRMFQILIEGVADYFIFVVDTNGHVASWNSAAQQITGYTADEILGQHFGIFYRPDERRTGDPKRALEMAAQKGKYDVEGWRIKKNGGLLFVSGSVTAVRDDSGTLVGFANILRDATERRNAQEKLFEAREQLAMAAEDGGDRQAHRRHRPRFQQSADDHRRQRTDLQTPARSEAAARHRGHPDRGEARRKPDAPVADLRPPPALEPDGGRSQRLYSRYAHDDRKLAARKYRLQRADRSRYPAGEFDLAELELAIVNIAVNARDAMPNGGTFGLTIVNVTVNRDEEHAARELVAIEFTDTGTGIPPNLLTKIFDPFFTTKEVGKGTGLGLSQVYGFAHQSGGMVTADSKVGQ